ncbi:MAG: amidohydrolase family protein [Acidobacteria bacterium]|nr:amidohydrolase family protein [Acidobacteriota bacterium]
MHRLALTWILGFLLAALPLPGGDAAPGLSPGAEALVARAFRGLGPGSVLDFHAHLVGLEAGGAFVNPRKLSPRHPLEWATTRLYLRASGVQGLRDFDRAYVGKLLERAGAFPAPLRIHLLAMDRVYRRDGSPDDAHTEFFVPNEAVVDLARRHPDRFVPVISVHPYRKDALEELDRWAAEGVRCVKWLPNAQGMDPADPLCDPFYARMAVHRMVLLSHAGEERAVKAGEAQRLGNPLRLRRALDAGVTVVVAHCAGLGEGEDLDHPGRRVPNFELFLRLMGEEKYRGRLFGDLSALTQANRMPGPLRAILRDPGLQARLVNGSDYPLPGIPLLVSPRQFARLGMVGPGEARAIVELLRTNPLLGDFVLKRTLRDPHSGKGLDPAIFTRDPSFLSGPPPAP